MHKSSIQRLVLAITVMLVVSAGIGLTGAGATLSSSEFEACLFDAINADRAANGVAALEMAYDVNDDVRAFSEKIGDEATLRHMTSAERNPILPDNTHMWRENVGWHSLPNLPGCSAIHDMFMNSPKHRTNILAGDVRFIALGVHMGSSGTWVTELFFNSSSYQPPAATAKGLFWDDDGSVFEADIEKLAAANITSGCNPPLNDRFCPSSHLTRGQMAAMLVRALDLNATNGTDFTDDDDSIFEQDIEKLAAAGITNGCNPPANTRYCPDAPLTRGQMAAMLARGLDLSTTDGTDFADDDHSVFETAIEQLAAAGITHGCNPPANTNFCPDAPLTRGQMAAFLVRALNL